MNEAHLVACASPEWRQAVEERLVPWISQRVSLGADVIEIGPGPGVTTDILRSRVPRLTAVEVDPDLAASLADRLAGTNVEVVRADATALPFEADRFSAATSFAMLHHVPSAGLQDRVFAELARVLRPGAPAVVFDSVHSDALEAFHEGDTYVPIDPDSLPSRLAAAGFVDVDIVVEEAGFGCTARTQRG